MKSNEERDEIINRMNGKKHSLYTNPIKWALLVKIAHPGDKGYSDPKEIVVESEDMTANETIGIVESIAEQLGVDIVFISARQVP